MDNATQDKGKNFFREKPTYSTHMGRIKALTAVSLLHFINDLHPTMLPAFLPEIVKRLSLSLGEAGFLSTLFGMSNLIVQPFAGHLADKLDRPLFALWAPLFTALGAYLLPISPNYGIAMLFATMLGVGTACFHPQGHGLAGLAGGEHKLGSYLAIFGAAGTLGAAVSPVYGVFLFRTLGPALMPIAIVLVFLVALVAKYLLPAHLTEKQEEAERKLKSKGNFRGEMTRVLAICMPLIIISIIRDSASQGIRVFLPLLVTERGGSLEFAGSFLFAFTVAGSAANIVGGKLADTFGKKKIIFIMLLISPLFLSLALRLEGIASLLLFVVGGACIAATNTVTLAMAQEYVPESRSTASSLVMGTSWGIANMVASPIGMVADKIGLNLTLSFVALMPLLVVIAMAIGYFKNKKRTG